MRPSPAQIERVAESLVRRLVQAQLLEPTAPEETIRARFAAILARNFEEEAEIEREASAEAERLVRKGAPGVRREDLDLRTGEKLGRVRNERLFLAETKRGLTEGFSLDGRLDQLARARMPKRVVPGSREWDVPTAATTRRSAASWANSQRRVHRQAARPNDPKGSGEA